MAKIFVQIRDRGSVFYDGGTGTTVAGSEPVEIEQSPKVVKAIKGGALRKLDPKEAKAILKQLQSQKELDTVESDEPTTPPAETVEPVDSINYNEFTVAELKEELTKRGIEVSNSLKKAEIVALLVENDGQVG